MSDGFPSLEYAPDEDEEISRYGDKTALLYYDLDQSLTPGDNIDIVDDEGDRLGGGYIDYVLRTPIHRLPTLALEGVPDFSNIDEAVAHFSDDHDGVESSDVVTVVGLYNVRWVGGYV